MGGFVKKWAIVSGRRSMSPGEIARWFRQWVPFAVRTVGYGIVSLVFGPLTRERRASLWAMRRWSIASARALGVRWQIEGLENVPEGGFVYAANHQSLLDILVLGASLAGDIKWGAKRSVMNVPFLGWHLRLAGHVPVDRKRGSKAAGETVGRFVRVLEGGKPLLIFPEGTRSLDGRVQAFKKGGFRAAVRTGRPVVPVALEGTARIMKKGAADTGASLHRRAQRSTRRVLIRVGAPIQPRAEGSEEERVADLCARAHAAVLRMHDELLAGVSRQNGR